MANGLNLYDVAQSFPKIHLLWNCVKFVLCLRTWFSTLLVSPADFVLMLSLGNLPLPWPRARKEYLPRALIGSSICHVFGPLAMDGNWRRPPFEKTVVRFLCICCWDNSINNGSFIPLLIFSSKHWPNSILPASGNGSVASKFNFVLSLPKFCLRRWIVNWVFILKVGFCWK